MLRYCDILDDSSMILKDYATVLEASEVLCVHPETVKRLCRRGQITANKLGNTWLINRETLAFFANNICALAFPGATASFVCVDSEFEPFDILVPPTCFSD